MSGAAMKALQRAVYERLHSHAPLMNLVSGIYDFVPEAAVFPYVLIEDVQSQLWEILHPSAFRCLMVLDVYSDQQGNKQAQTIIATIGDLLQQPLNVAGFDVGLVEVQRADVERVDDTVLRRARILLNVWLKGV